MNGGFGRLRQGFDESIQQAAVRAGVDVEARPRLAHPESRPMGALPAGILADAQYRRGLAVAVLEDVVQEKGGPLFGAKPLQEQQERQPQALVSFMGKVGLIGLGRERLRQPRPDVLRPLRLGAPEAVQR